MADIVKQVEDKGEFIQLEDGFWYYWPQVPGAIGEYDLFLLHKELVRRNKKTIEVVDKCLRNSSAALGGEQ